MQEYLLALSYFSALTIVCLVLYSFTYFLPKPDNINKAKSTFYFRLILLFTVAAFAATLLRYENYHQLSLVLNNLFILLISYKLRFAVYTRYDHKITRVHYIGCALHTLVLTGMLIYIDVNFEFGSFRYALVLGNLSIP